MSATTTPLPAAPTVDTTSQPAPALTAAPPLFNTIENLDVLKDDGPLKNKASHRPAYLDYDEEAFKQKLQVLVDPSRWAEGWRDMNRVITLSFLFFHATHIFPRLNGINH